MRLRVLIAVTHLLGIGHIARAAAVGRAFAEAGHRVTLLTGGLASRLVPLDGLEVVQLPPVQARPGDFRTLLDAAGQPVTPDLLRARKDVMLQCLGRVRPDVVATELFPFGRRGLADEFSALLAAAHAMLPRPLVVSSVRDILVAPDRPAKIAEAHARLARFYDAVLVHGDRDLVPLEASWPLDAASAAMLRYTGYVDGLPAPVFAGARSGVLVSGGGSGAGLPLYQAALAAARLVPEQPWRILVGHGVDEQAFGKLARGASGNLTVERARPGFRDLLAKAQVSVSQAGYNTVVDLLRTGTRSVLVPFEAGQETEQRRRAESLALHRLASLVREASLSGEALAEAVRTMIDADPPPGTRIRLDGAAESVRIVEGMMAARATMAKAAVTAGRGRWRRLSEALDRSAERGGVAIWWRDDDAVEPTPELERLLALARRNAMPLALACIPATATRALAARLADEPLVTVLVHGLSHANHEPAGSKKAEFGPARPLSALLADVKAALQAAEGLFAGRLAPIFVPPWNRIAPALPDRLAEIGYEGLSAFSLRVCAPRGLFRRLDTHLDPIDWHGTGSLADPDPLLARLAALIAQGAADSPIGLLTHHLVADEAVWDFCERLLDTLAKHPSVRLQSITTIGSRLPSVVEA
jgi:predicted glycosyltransferase